MSNRSVQQVKALITADLSVVEKAQLVEWLGADLRQELLADETVQPPASPASEAEITPHNGSNAFAKTDDEVIAAHELPWEEQPWTTEELRELMRPDPKTGAEIAELIDRLDLRADGKQWTFLMSLNGLTGNARKKCNAEFFSGWKQNSDKVYLLENKKLFL